MMGTETGHWHVTLITHTHGFSSAPSTQHNTTWHQVVSVENLSPRQPDHLTFVSYINTEYWLHSFWPLEPRVIELIISV